MRRLWAVLLLGSVFAAAPGFMQSQTDKRGFQSTFLVDASKPYVYLEVDHIGPREPRSEDEPKTGIWLRLHNNCKVPIIVRTFGVPPGSAEGEIGVLDDVVPSPNAAMGDGVVTYGTLPMADPHLPALFGGQSDAKREAPSIATATATMPHGYMFPTSSFVTIAPGRAIYFSLPVDHVSKSWHVEIPFRLDLKVRTPIRAPSSFVSLYQDDLPATEKGPSSNR